MLQLPRAVRILLAAERVDLRYGIDGLAAIVRNVWRENLYAGHLFVFVSRRGDRVKVLSWDNGGFVLYYKRLESGRFRLPPVPKDALGARLDATQLAMLLDGIDVAGVRRPTRWTPPEDARGNLQMLPDLISPARWTSPRLTRASGATRRNASVGKSPGCSSSSPPSRGTSSRCSGPSSESEARRCRPSASSCAGTSRRPRTRR